jgi:hypothetical protein
MNIIDSVIEEQESFEQPSSQKEKKVMAPHQAFVEETF